LACRIWCLRAALGWSALVGANEWFLASGWQWYSNRTAKGAGVLPAHPGRKFQQYLWFWLPCFFLGKGLWKSSRVVYDCFLAILILVNRPLPLFDPILRENIAVIDDGFSCLRYSIDTHLSQMCDVHANLDVFKFLDETNMMFRCSIPSIFSSSLVRAHSCCSGTSSSTFGGIEYHWIVIAHMRSPSTLVCAENLKVIIRQALVCRRSHTQSLVIPH
jgi:hypothetical protein